MLCQLSAPTLHGLAADYTVAGMLATGRLQQSFGLWGVGQMKFILQFKQANFVFVLWCHAEVFFIFW